MFSTVTGNDWTTFDLGVCESPPRKFPNWLPSLSFVDLHSLFQCWPLSYLLHIPKGWVLLFLLFPEEILFLGILCLQSLLRCSILPQLSIWYFDVFSFLWKLLLLPKIQYESNVSVFIVCRIHSSTGADLTFKGPSIFLHSNLTFSKARDLVSTHLSSGFLLLFLQP